MFGIRCFEVEHDIDGDGRILLGANGRPKIEYAAGRMKERQAFTIFHEFAHTLFPDYCDFLPLHHAAAQSSPEEKEFESLCDTAAAEMLFPSDEFTDDLKGIGRLHFPELLRLQQRYGGSLDATCYRMAELISAIPVSFAFMTDQRGSFSGGGPLWVKHSSGNKLFKGYIKGGERPPKDSVATICYAEQSQSVGPVRETWWIDGSPRSYMAEAVKLPTVANPDYPKLVVILLPLSYKGGSLCI
ncbi:hypothetical protein BGE01nite_01820 [Brevifollis gellanilyticus]|uniref:IrrE N-terminal-like domain-containing protein n=1 Tax=Brevifollis gellanilyticus TaxID=748831 RepID=A0A512M3K1_9BACT|nr:hypothetical protein BGE01nite_01820 [Brevifollis gellanilyticus]